MPSPVEAVDELARQWRQSPSGAIDRLRVCERLFQHRCHRLEDTLDGFLAPPSRPTEDEPGEERAWRWSRASYILFWIAVAVLCFGALVAGYVAAAMA